MSKQKEAQYYTIKDNLITCPICQHDKFWKSKAQLNTTAATFFKMDWLDKEVLTLICENCSYILWFNEEQ